MRIVFAGTPEFAAIQLKALLDAKFEVVAVYTQPDKPAGRGQHLHMSPVKELALLHHIPVEQPSTLKNDEAITTLKKYDADLMVVAAYGLLLPKSILDTPRFGCINVHASLLPRWRGASPIQQAILAGDKETGVTLMQMDVGLDTGDMLAKTAYLLKPTDTSTTVHDALAQQGAQLLTEQLAQFENVKKWPNLQPQDDKLATHAPKILKEQAKIDWHLSAVEIDRKVRGFNPWPCAFSTIQNNILKLWQGEVIYNQPSGAPGEIVAHTAQGIIIATSQDAFLLTHAQLPGKKMMPITELIKGHQDLFAIGNKLG